MKTVLFISSNKMLGQGLSAAFQSKPELDFLWAAQLNYPQAVVGIDIFHADVVILDIADQADMEQAVEICRSIRRNEQDPGQAGTGHRAQSGCRHKKCWPGR